MFLAGGLVAFGGAMIWKHASPKWLVPMAAGCLIAVGDAALRGLVPDRRERRHRPPRRSARRAIGAPPGGSRSSRWCCCWRRSPPRPFCRLRRTRASRRTSRSRRTRTPTTNRISASSRSTSRLEARSSPTCRDGSSTSSRAPTSGRSTTSASSSRSSAASITLAVLALLAASIFRDPRGSVARAGPFLYIAVALLLAYSLSAGNAGTAFRYRTHVLVPAIAALVVLRTRPDEVAATQQKPAASEGAAPPLPA